MRGPADLTDLTPTRSREILRGPARSCRLAEGVVGVTATTELELPQPGFRQP
jgi:hypothetical protein